MKHLLLFTSLVVFFGYSQGQEYYQIKSLGHTYSVQTIEDAFQSADFCGSYFQAKRNKIVFDDGAIVELKSFAELMDEGIQNMNSCISDTPLNCELFEWSISSTGSILKGSKTNAGTSLKEKNI